MRARSAGLLAPLLLAACATTSTTGLQVVRSSDRPLVGVRALAVYPFGLRGQDAPHRSFLLAMAAAEALGEKDRLLVFGPDEFTVFRHDTDDPRLATDLLGAMARRNLPTTAFVALRAWAEKRVVLSTGEVDAQGVARRSELVTWVEHLEVLDGGGEGVLLELRGEAVRDAAAARDPYDPSAELTRLHRDLVARAWALLEPRLTTLALSPLPLELRWLPAAALGWASPGQQPLSARLAADPAEADLQRLALYGFVDPDASQAVLAGRLRLPGGVLVERAEEPWSPALRPGDVIVEVAGEPAAGTHAVRRGVALASAHGGTVPLTVVRGGARLSVSVTPSAR
jgi:hypothetical protein